MAIDDLHLSSNLLLLSTSLPELAAIRDGSVLSVHGRQTEQIVVRNALWMLRGISEEIFQWNSSTDAFEMASDVHIPHLTPSGLATLVNPLVQAATSSYKLQSFIDAVQTSSLQFIKNEASSSMSPTMQSFSNSLRYFLNEFRSAVSVIEAEEIEKGGLSLCSLVAVLWRHCEEIQFLQSVAQAAAPHVVGESQEATSAAAKASYLIDSLYIQLDLAVSDINKRNAQILLILLLASIQPLMEHLQRWLLHGRVQDPADEFFITTVEDREAEWSHERMVKHALRRGTALRDSFASYSTLSDAILAVGDSLDGCPLFLQPIAEAILAAGESAQLIGPQDSETCTEDIETFPKYGSPVLHGLKLPENASSEAAMVEEDIQTSFLRAVLAELDFGRGDCLAESPPLLILESSSAMAASPASTRTNDEPQAESHCSTSAMATSHSIGQFMAEFLDFAKLDAPMKAFGPLVVQTWSEGRDKEQRLRARKGWKDPGGTGQWKGMSFNPIGWDCSAAMDSVHHSLLQKLTSHLAVHVPEPSVLLQRCLVSPLERKVLSIGKDLLQKLTGEWKLESRLSVLRDVFFMASGGLFLPFIALLPTSPKSTFWRDPALFNVSLQKCSQGLEDADVKAFLAGLHAVPSQFQEPSSFVLSLGPSPDPTPSNGDGLKCLEGTQFKWEMQWPLDLILDQRSKATYNKVLVFLLKVAWAKYRLDQLSSIARQERSQRGASSSSSSAIRSPMKVGLVRLTHLLTHFVNALQHFVMDHVTIKAWSRLNGCIRAAASLEAVVEAHRVYLGTAEKYSFLTHDKLGSLVAARVSSLLSMSLQFCNLHTAAHSRCSISTASGDEQWEESVLGSISDLHRSATRHIVYLVQILSSKASSGSHLKDFVTLLDFNNYFREIHVQRVMSRQQY